MRLAINQLWRGSGPYANRIDDEINSLIYEIKIRNGFNKDALKQHVTAIKKSRSRLDELHKILCPTLITQGKSDPLIDIKHFLKYEKLIKNKRNLYIEGMGHDIPDFALSMINNKILNIINTKTKN